MSSDLDQQQQQQPAPVEKMETEATPVQKPPAPPPDVIFKSGMSRLDLDNPDEVEDYIERMDDHIDSCVKGGVKIGEIWARNPDFKKEYDEATRRKEAHMNIYEIQKKRIESKLADKSIMEEIDEIVKSSDPRQRKSKRKLRSIICANGRERDEAEEEYKKQRETQKKEHEEEIAALKRRHEEDQKASLERLAQYEERTSGGGGNTKRHQRDTQEERTKAFQSRAPTSTTTTTVTTTSSRHSDQLSLLEALRGGDEKIETRPFSVSVGFMENMGYGSARAKMLPRPSLTGTEGDLALQDVLGENRRAWENKIYTATGR